MTDQEKIHVAATIVECLPCPTNNTPYSGSKAAKKYLEESLDILKRPEYIDKPFVSYVRDSIEFALYGKVAV